MGKKKKKRKLMTVTHEDDDRPPPAYVAPAPAAPAVEPAQPAAKARSAEQLEKAAAKLYPDTKAVDCPENLAVMYPQAQPKFDKALADGSVPGRPGIDCCAVCAAPTDGPGATPSATECRKCARVAYCSPNCCAVDARVHARACRLLRLSELDEQFRENCCAPPPTGDTAAHGVEGGRGPLDAPPSGSPPWAAGWSSLLDPAIPRLARWAVSSRLSHTFTLIDAVWHLRCLGEHACNRQSPSHLCLLISVTVVLRLQRVYGNRCTALAARGCTFSVRAVLSATSPLGPTARAVSLRWQLRRKLSARAAR